MPFLPVCLCDTIGSETKQKAIQNQVKTEGMELQGLKWEFLNIYIYTGFGISFFLVGKSHRCFFTQEFRC